MHKKRLFATLLPVFVLVLIIGFAQTALGHTAEDFVLTISVEESTLSHDELSYRHFWYYVELENRSGKDLDIIVNILFRADIPNWWNGESGMDMPEWRTISFPKNSVIRREPWYSSDNDEPQRFGEGASGNGHFGGEEVGALPIGTHELTVSAVFRVICEQGNENALRILSNTVTLTVTAPKEETTIYESDEITVTIDGTPVNFPDQAPVIVEGRTLVPVRGVFEELGYYVTWDEYRQQVRMSQGGRSLNRVEITVGSRDFIANGLNLSLEIPAQIINGRVMLPIRAILEGMGYTMDWNGDTRSVLISTEPRPTFRITYNRQGGFGAESSRQTNSTGRIPMMPSAHREGYTFTGWFTAPVGGEPVDRYTVFNANTTIYAQWIQAVLYRNFTLTVTVDEAVLPQGERFRVVVELKNIGDDVEVLLDYPYERRLGWASISSFNFASCGYGCPLYVPLTEEDRATEVPPPPQTRSLSTGYVLTSNAHGGCCLPPGKHELSFVARFRIGRENIRVYSNTITITVQ